MTTERILELAYRGALEMWSQANQKLIENPENKRNQRTERKRWEELEEIRRIIIAEEE